MIDCEAKSVQAPTSREAILVSGASFAGLATAYWTNRLGYKVTVVDIAPSLKKGGTPVDIKQGTVDIVRRMGLLDQIKSRALKPKRTQFLDMEGIAVAEMSGEPDGTSDSEDCEIERDDLLEIMYGEISDQVEFIFGDRISQLVEGGDDVVVTFKGGVCRRFALMFGCDGNRSAVRRLQFGPDAEYTHFLQHYFGITIIDRLLIEEDTTQIYNVPGKAVMLNAYQGQTDIVFSYFSENEVQYDYRDQGQQLRLVHDQFTGTGWRTDELLDELERSSKFYFDKFCQIRMPSWTKGRVALVGDAGYCASPAAGMGGSLAIVGASALNDAFEKHGSDFVAAFQEYNRKLGPFVLEVQSAAVDFGLRMFVPRTENDIRRRNEEFA